MVSLENPFLISFDDRLIAHPDRVKVFNKEIISTFIDKSKLFDSKQYYNENNEQIIATHAKIELGLNWFLVIEQTSEEANSLIRELIRKMIIFTTLASLLALFVGIFFVRKISKPIETLIEGVSEYGNGKLDHRIKLNSNDELDKLAEEFNNMANNIQYHQKKLRRVERSSLINKMVRMVSHEIRNPLNAMNINLQILKRAIKRDNAGDVGKKTKYLDILSSEILRMDDLITNYVSLAEPPKLDFRFINIHETIDNVILLHQAQANQFNVHIAQNFTEKELNINIDESQFKQVLTNIILNGIQAMPDGGNLKISTEKGNFHCTVRIEDNGVGIETNKLEEVFEFAYTSKKSGSGIGLSLSKSIIEGHHGTIYAESIVGEGTTFFIVLPLKQEHED